MQTKYLQRAGMAFFSALIILGFSVRVARAGYEQGDSNPTGVSGIYNGNITTGCSYDSYTGNAHREINDIVVPGCVGAYPLRWTRYWNSHMTYAASSSGGWDYSYLGFGYDSVRNITYFPDGRAIDCGSPNGCPYGYEEMTGPFGAPDGGYVTYGSHGATGLVDPYGNVTTFTRQTTIPYLITKVTEPGGRYLQINYDANYNLQSVQAFDGIAGHPASQSVTYTWSNFTLSTGTVKVLTRADYSDGTFATYTYTDQKYKGPPVCTYPFQSTDRHAALVATADDVRYTGPMRQIKYQYVGSGTRIASEKNFVTSEAVSTISGVTNGGTTTATETRGDGPTRTFHYHDVQHCMDCPPPDTECSPPEPTDGKLLDYTDFLGHTTTIGYDGNGFINSVTDANNHTTTYTRGTGPGQANWAIYQITHVVDNSSIVQDYWNNNPPYLWHRTDELGHTTTYTRDANNRVTHKAYPDGGYEDFTYNSFGEVLIHSRAQSAGPPLVIETESFVYDLQGRGLMTTHTDAAGGTTTYTYYTSSDYGGVWTDRVKTVTKPANASGYQASETYEYDRLYVGGVDTGAPCAGRGLVTKIIHDDPANPGGLHGDGTYQTFTHDIYGNLLSSTDELGHATSNTYDAYRRVLTTSDPLNHTVTNNYVPTGKTSSWITTSSLPFYTTLPSTKKTTFYYDANWRKTRVQQAPGTGADEANTYFYYDTYAGYTNVGELLLATVDPRGYATKYHYDIRDRQDQITDALGASLGDLNHTMSFTFDMVGNKLTEIHPITPQGAELIEYDQYDAMNRLLHKKVHRDATTIDQTTVQYDLAGNLINQWDENGNLYQYNYDQMNRRTKMIYPDTNKHEDSAYDAAGNVATYLNRNTKTQTFVYDNRNRQTGFSWNDSGVTPSQTTTFDAASRVTQVANSVSTINHTFDNANRLLTEEEWTSAFTDNVHRTMTYTYDVDNNRQNVQYPSGTAFNYTYTNRNQAASIRPGLSGGTAIASYVYDTSGNITSCIRDNGTSTAYTVDVANRDTAILHNDVGGTKRFDYAYNSVNDILAVQRDSSLGDGFRYDRTQQVLEYQQNGTVNLGAGTVSSPATDTNLTFDGCGNRKSLNGVNLAMPNNMNQPTDPGIGYDSEGNLQTYNAWIYTYDAQNRLTNATNGSVTAIFYYDGKNRQIARSISGAAPTFSVWDDWELVEEYGTGNVRTAAYLQGAHGPIKSLMANIYFYQDELGSTSHITDATGHLLEYYKYDLYGKPTYWNASNTQISASAYGIRDLFSGERLVTELGLYDLRNRYYLPDLGRFLQPDPIGFKGDASNLYRYCGNDWANKTDPMGLDVTPFDPGFTIKLRDSLADAVGVDLLRQIRTLVAQAPQAIHQEPGGTSRVEVTGLNQGSRRDSEYKSDPLGNITDRGAPDNLKIVPGDTKIHPNYTDYYIQVMRGNTPLKGPMASMETVTIDQSRTHGVKVEKSNTSNDHFKAGANGKIHDQVGLWPKSPNAKGDVYKKQSYQIWYDGARYNVPSRFEQHSHVENNHVTNELTPLP